jgi:hypothetical protein
MSAWNTSSGVAEISAKPRSMPATPSATALGAFFDPVADLKSGWIVASVVIFAS